MHWHHSKHAASTQAELMHRRWHPVKKLARQQKKRPSRHTAAMYGSSHGSESVKFDQSNMYTRHISQHNRNLVSTKHLSST